MSFAGIFGLHWDLNVGECTDLRLLNPRVALAVAKEQSDLVVGIKVGVGAGTSGGLGNRADADRAGGGGICRPAADGPPGQPGADPVRRCWACCGRGDIITHCFRPFPNAPATPEGGIHPMCWRRGARGVIFDIGHGRGSFGFESAMAMLKNGFLPDVISSDVHLTSIGGPAFSMLVTMSKFLQMGVPLKEVIRASTINPARAVRLEDRGTLGQGLLGDATILEMERGSFTFTDTVGVSMQASEQLACAGSYWADAGGTTARAPSR